MMELVSAVADTQFYHFPPDLNVEPRLPAHPVHSYHIPFIQVFLVGEISNNLVIIQPLQVTIEQDEDESYIVSDEIFLVYGDGNTIEDAIIDYVSSIIEFFEILEDSQEDPFDQRQFLNIQKFIKYEKDVYFDHSPVLDEVHEILRDSEESLYNRNQFLTFKKITGS